MGPRGEGWAADVGEEGGHEEVADGPPDGVGQREHPLPWEGGGDGWESLFGTIHHT